MLHVAIKNKVATTVIEYLVNKIKEQCGEKEIDFRTDVLETISPLSKLSVQDKASASSVYAPLFFEY